MYVRTYVIVNAKFIRTEKQGDIYRGNETVSRTVRRALVSLIQEFASHIQRAGTMLRSPSLW
jgi:hypothetical protein